MSRRTRLRLLALADGAAHVTIAQPSRTRFSDTLSMEDAEFFDAWSWRGLVLSAGLMLGTLVLATVLVLNLDAAWVTATVVVLASLVAFLPVAGILVRNALLRRLAPTPAR